MACMGINFDKISCIMLRISKKLIPYSIQVHHKLLKASSEAGVSNVLSGSVRLLEADICIRA